MLCVPSLTWPLQYGTIPTLWSARTDILVALTQREERWGWWHCWLSWLGRWGYDLFKCPPSVQMNLFVYPLFFSRKRSWAPAPTSSSSAAQSSSTADTNTEASQSSSSHALNKLLSGLPEVKQAKGRSSCFDASVRYLPVLWICIGFNAVPDPDPEQALMS